MLLVNWGDLLRHCLDLLTGGRPGYRLTLEVAVIGTEEQNVSFRGKGLTVEMVILVIKLREVRGYRLLLTTLEGAVAVQRARAVEVDLRSRQAKGLSLRVS